MTESIEQVTYLQQLCDQAYDLLKQRWPSWKYNDQLKFDDELNPYGRRGKLIFFCGDAQLQATDYRFICIAEPVLEYQGHASDFTVHPIWLPYNSHIDLVLICALIEYRQLEDPDLFNRDRPPEWLTERLKQLGLHQ